MEENIQIIFTDLDGTLLNSEKRISPTNHGWLKELGRQNIIRVIATGRSLYSFRQLSGKYLPADYLIFSTGAGIIDLQTDTLLYSANMEKGDIHRASCYLQEQRVDFMVHHTVPDNHRFFYWGGGGHANSDFDRRIELYSSYARELTTLEHLPDNAAQIIAIFPEDLPRFNRVATGLPDYRITRTTSPLDGRSIWMEIFPSHVGKGPAAAWLCNHLNLDRRLTVGIGNDYNDLSLLEYTEHSYVVANAPAEMLRDFTTTSSNDNDGFYHATRAALGIK
jgi:hypothetical protein